MKYDCGLQMKLAEQGSYFSVVDILQNKQLTVFNYFFKLALSTAWKNKSYSFLIPAENLISFCVFLMVILI